MARVLIAGCGYVGTALGEALAADGHGVWGLRRRAVAPSPSIRPLTADLGLPSSLERLPSSLDYVFYMASPAGPDDLHYRAVYVDGLRNLLEVLDKQGQRPVRVFFASSTSVYAQSEGEWVDESAPTEPTSHPGIRLLEGEGVLRESPFAGTVVRFGGIYGPRRTTLIDRVRAGSAVYRADRPRYTNRIHRDDCAGALRHLMRLGAPEPLYLGVDCEPVDEATLLRWLAGVLGAPEPRPAPPGEAGTRRREGNKRCRNKRLVSSGYGFRHPTFREGYRAVLRDLT